MARSTSVSGISLATYVALTLSQVYANAGIVERNNFYTEEAKLPPPKLPLLVMDVCLTGVVYSTYLGMHYMRQNPSKKGGSIIMVSSAAGIYPSYQLPLYAAAKHGVVGLMRSLAPELAKENIRVNCTLPGAVRTNLCDSDTWDLFPQQQFTTVDNIISAVTGLLEDTSLTGKAVEISQGKVYYRDQHGFCDDQMKMVMGAAGDSSY
jgi:15-hydroxyprostaglandin dehydrogenase (NAD)